MKKVLLTSALCLFTSAALAQAAPAKKEEKKEAPKAEVKKDTKEVKKEPAKK